MTRILRGMLCLAFAASVANGAPSHARAQSEPPLSLPPTLPARTPPYVQLQPALHPITVVTPARRHGDASAAFSFGMGASLLWLDDEGYRLTGWGERQAHFDLFASYDVFHPSQHWVIAAGASFRTLGGGGDADRAAELRLRTLQADLTARYRRFDWFVPHARVAAGAGFVRLDVEDQELSASYQGKDQVFVGNLGAGFTLRTKTRFFESRRGRLASLSFGVLVEGGVVLAPSAEPGLRASDMLSEGIERRQAELGTLDLTGPFLRIACVTRF